jgi:hypothetical protein
MLWSRYNDGVLVGHDRDTEMTSRCTSAVISLGKSPKQLALVLSRVSIWGDFFETWN